jgi:non-canonical (house-cleaning) NTP pyrophosphatase
MLVDSEDQVEFLGYDVGSGVSGIPLSPKDLMGGARGQVENLILQLKREKAEADFYVGLQAGFNAFESMGPRRLTFLESWAYVSDGHRGSYGHGGGIVVPPEVADPVIDRGIDLSIVLDRFRGSQDLQSEQGPWGLLTRDILSDRHSFVVALICAFAPFYNREAYS